jgi:hypothetical protein
LFGNRDRVRLGLCALAIALATASCRSRSTANSAPMQTYDGTVAEVITQLATDHHVAAIIDPNAHDLASCARVRFTAPRDMPPAAAMGFVNTGVRTVGLRVSLENSGWSVSRDLSVRAVYPRECRGRAGLGGLAGIDPLDPGMRPAMPTAPLPPVSPSPFAPPADAGADLTSIIDGVHQRSDTEFDVTRRALDAFLVNQVEVMRTTRIIPNEHDGVVTGVRIYGVRSSSIMRLIGFQNGDEIQTVNGFDVSAPDRALEAYARVRRASELHVRIVRRGAPIEIVYHVTP